MWKMCWPAWRRLSAAHRAEVLSEAVAFLGKMEQNPTGQSALYSLLGHKGDLLIVHFRDSLDALNQAELELAC
ncbi:MAG: chlorite dismutase family protein, partial [Acidobacteria bacterium]|nr:chlorite dismutase family protein [Acidobacteriota bacterium]